MNKIILIIAIISLITISYLYYKQKQCQSDMKALQMSDNNQIASLQTNITSLKNNIDTLSATYDKCNSDLKSDNSQIASLQSNLTSIKTEIDTLSKTYTNCQSDMAAVKASNEAQKTTIATRDNTITGLNSQIVDFKTTIAKRDSAIADLNNKITDFKTTIAERDNTITGLNSQIADFKTTIATRDFEIGKCNSANTYFKTTIEARDNTIADLNKKIADLLKYKPSLPGKYSYYWKGVLDGNVEIVATGDNSYQISKLDGKSFLYTFEGAGAKIINMTVDKTSRCTVNNFDIGSLVVIDGIVDTIGTKDSYMFFKRI